jgi:hypothetical protein
MASENGNEEKMPAKYAAAKAAKAKGTQSMTAKPMAKMAKAESESRRGARTWRRSEE